MIIKKIIGNVNRRLIWNGKFRKAVNNDHFTILSSNCRGGGIYHDLGMEFLSPTINLWFSPLDFLMFVKNLEYYLEITPLFEKTVDINTGKEYPLGLFDDIHVHFSHSNTEHEALEEWNRRKQRIQWDNIFVLATEFRECNYEILCEMDRLPYPTVIFTAHSYPELKNTVYIPGFEGQGYVGYLGEIDLSGRRLDEKYFDFAEWLNKR